jgi:hypothetical protein
MEYILTSIKKLLGIAPEYKNFDMDLIIHINTVLAILTQLGVGPQNGFTVDDEYTSWDSLLGDDQRLELVKSYVYLKVKLLFDPPTSSAVAESNKRLCDELEWRILNTPADPVV